MKTRSAIQLLFSFLLIGALFFSSCKKKDPEPAPSANTDNVDMGTDPTATIDVLANDTYKGSPSVSVATNTAYGTVVVNSDKTITYTPKVNFYGTATFTYTVNDENGSGSGSIIIKVGNDAQIRSYTIINAFKSEPGLYLYSIDGDTASALVYKPQYGNYQINYSVFDTGALLISSKNVMPNIGNYPYSYVADGNILTRANSDGSNVVFEVVDYFTATDAKKQDGSGYMTVNGYTIRYNGKLMAFTTQVR